MCVSLARVLRLISTDARAFEAVEAKASLHILHPIFGPSACKILKYCKIMDDPIRWFSAKRRSA